MTIALPPGMSRAAVAGFTLIETLVASGLVVAISLGTAQLFSYAIAQTSTARDQILMGLAASAKLDELTRVVATGTPPSSPDDTLDRDVDGWYDVVAQSGRTYKRRWNIHEAPAYGSIASVLAIRVIPRTGGADLTLVTVRRNGVP